MHNVPVNDADRISMSIRGALRGWIPFGSCSRRGKKDPLSARESVVVGLIIFLARLLEPARGLLCLAAMVPGTLLAVEWFNPRLICVTTGPNEVRDG
jgi:hypothetical protein